MRKVDYDQDYYRDIVEQSLGGMSAKYRKFLSYANLILNPEVIVDLGSGSGTLCAYLKGRFPEAQVVGLEKFEIPLVASQEAYPDIDFRECDLDEASLPIDSGTADLVVSHEVIEHLRNVGHFVREAHRILRPGGTLLLKSPNRLDAMRFFAPIAGKTWYADEDKTHVQYFDVSAKRLLLETGFSAAWARTGTKPLAKIGPLKIPAIPFLGNGLVVVGRK